MDLIPLIGISWHLNQLELYSPEDGEGLSARVISFCVSVRLAGACSNLFYLFLNVLAVRFPFAQETKLNKMFEPLTFVQLQYT